MAYPWSTFANLGKYHLSIISLPAANDIPVMVNDLVSLLDAEFPSIAPIEPVTGLEKFSDVTFVKPLPATEVMADVLVLYENPIVCEPEPFALHCSAE